MLAIYILIAVGFFLASVDEKDFQRYWVVYLICAVIWPVFVGMNIFRGTTKPNPKT